MFTDNVSENVSALEDLFSGLPRPAKARAMNVAKQFETLFNTIRQDNPKDPAAAVGAAIAIFKMAEGLITKDNEEKASGGGLIQLLS